MHVGVETSRALRLAAEYVEEYRRDVPLGRMGTPGEVADVVAFLSSDGARFITGERITVNGGHTID